MEKAKAANLADVTEALTAVMNRFDAFEKKIDCDLATVAETILSGVFSDR